MLRGREGTVYGGSELRAWRFARGLADLGFDVSITGFDDEAVPADVLGPVSIVGPSRAPSWSTRLRSRISGKSQPAQETPWQNADADVYVAFGAAEYNADLGEWCRAKRRPFLLFAGSDADFSEDYRPGNSARNIWGSRCDRCYDSIQLASKLVVQSRTQERVAGDRFGRDAIVIANPVVMATARSVDVIGDAFLWIGKAVDNKRPELAFAVAEACPDQFFVMIANDVGNGLFEKLTNEKPPNVELIASVPPTQLDQYFSRARALLCTSDFEGFPNTFLDAGRSGVPVITLRVDPDGVIARERGGFSAQGDFNELVQAVKRFAAESEVAIDAGKRLHDYVKREHEASARVMELAEVLRDLTALPRVEAGATG